MLFAIFNRLIREKKVLKGNNFAKIFNRVVIKNIV